VLGPSLLLKIEFQNPHPRNYLKLVEFASFYSSFDISLTNLIAMRQIFSFIKSSTERSIFWGRNIFSIRIE
jgi:hypothetical protein